VLVTKADRFTKSPALRQAKVTLGEGLLTSEGDFHRRQRKLSQPAFHPHRVATYAGGDRPPELARRQPSGRDGRVVDLHEEMMRVTLRIVTEVLFSASVDAEIDEIGRSMHDHGRDVPPGPEPVRPDREPAAAAEQLPLLRAQAHVRATVERFRAEIPLGPASTAATCSRPDPRNPLTPAATRRP
jgi:cytochrome P450